MSDDLRIAGGEVMPADPLRELAALLAESEPVDWSQPQDLIITIEGPLPEPAPLKLGHPYKPCPGLTAADQDHCIIGTGNCHYPGCGQPSEAH